MKGSCFCGQVKFQLDTDKDELYQCHCSICRKITGSVATTTIVVEGDEFKWLSGEENLKLFVHQNGRRSVFCQSCGSPAPDPNPDKSLYWVPAGLLTNHENMSVTSHIFTGSKADWDNTEKNGMQHAAHFSK